MLPTSRQGASVSLRPRLLASTSFLISSLCAGALAQTAPSPSPQSPPAPASAAPAAPTAPSPPSPYETGAPNVAGGTPVVPQLASQMTISGEDLNARPILRSTDI